MRFVSTFLFFFAQIITTQFVLGFFSLINTFALVTLNLLVSASLFLYLYHEYGSSLPKRYLTALRKAVIQLSRILKNDPLFTILLLVSLVILLWIGFLGILFPALDIDGNSYHLTFIGNVVQYHNFFDHPTSVTWLNGYPKGGEFIAMWSVVISGYDTFTDLTQIPFLFLGIWALYEIATSLGAQKNQARFSALLFLFAPAILNQIKTTYVDVILASLFFAGLAMLIRKRKFSTSDFLVIGIIFSLLIATKSTGILFIFVLLPLLGWNLFTMQYQRKMPTLSELLKTLQFIVLPMIFGLYWYLKNLILYGSPIYPFGFKIGSISVFPGKTFSEFASAAVNSTNSALPSNCVERIWFVWTEQKDWFGCLYNYDANYSGLGPIWFILFLPAILVGVVWAIRKRHYIYLGFLGLIVALFVVYPANYYSRYTLFVVAAGTVSFALILTHVSKRLGDVIKACTIILAISVFFMNFTLCNFGPALIKKQLQDPANASSRGAIAKDNQLLVAFGFLGNKVKPDDTVVYDSSPYLIYPLWRPDLRNTVLYLPAKNATEWNAELKQHSADYVVTTLLSKENMWAHKGKLEGIYKDELYEIFETN